MVVRDFFYDQVLRQVPSHEDTQQDAAYRHDDLCRNEIEEVKESHPEQEAHIRQRPEAQGA